LSLFSSPSEGFNHF